MGGKIQLPSPKCTDRIVNGQVYDALLKEVHYLRHFYHEADFGPAHEEVVQEINEQYNRPIPTGY